jgi:hypothetical protein
LQQLSIVSVNVEAVVVSEQRRRIHAGKSLDKQKSQFKFITDIMLAVDGKQYTTVSQSIGTPRSTFICTARAMAEPAWYN